MTQASGILRLRGKAAETPVVERQDSSVGTVAHLAKGLLPDLAVEAGLRRPGAGQRERLGDNVHADDDAAEASPRERETVTPPAAPDLEDPVGGRQASAPENGIEVALSRRRIVGVICCAVRAAMRRGA